MHKPIQFHVFLNCLGMFLVYVLVLSYTVDNFPRHDLVTNKYTVRGLEPRTYEFIIQQLTVSTLTHYHLPLSFTYKLLSVAMRFELRSSILTPTTLRYEQW